MLPVEPGAVAAGWLALRFRPAAFIPFLSALACKRTPGIPDRMRRDLQWSARTTPPLLRYGAAVLTMNPVPLPPA